MSSTNPAPEKKKPEDQSPDTLFAAFDKDISQQMTAHIAGAVKRGLDRSRRDFAKQIAADAIGHMPDGLSEAIDKLPNAKVFEILTAHQQTQEFRQQNLETRKAENEVVAKEIDNTKKLQETRAQMEESQLKADKQKMDNFQKEQELDAIAQQQGFTPSGMTPEAMSQALTNKDFVGPLSDSASTIDQLRQAGAEIQSNFALGTFATKEDRRKAAMKLQGVVAELSQRTGLSQGAIRQQVLARTFNTIPGVSAEKPVYNFLGLKSSRQTSARLFAGIQALSGAAKTSQAAVGTKMREMAARAKAGKPEDPVVGDAYRLTEQITLDRLNTDAGMLISGISADGETQLPSAGSIGFGSEAYQTIISAKAAAQARGDQASVKNLTLMQVQEVDRFLDEWMERTDFGESGSDIALNKMTDNLKKVIEGPEGLTQKIGKPKTAVGVAQGAAVLFQVNAVREYARLIRNRFPQKALERNQKKRAEADKKARERARTTVHQDLGGGAIEVFLDQMRNKGRQ